MDELAQLNARAVSELDSNTCSASVPLAPPEAAEYSALVQLKASLEEYVAEQRAIVARTRKTVQDEVEKQAAGLSDSAVADQVSDNDPA